MIKYYNDIVSEWHVEWTMNIYTGQEREHEEEYDFGTHFYRFVRFRRLTDVRAVL